MVSKHHLCRQLKSSWQKFCELHPWFEGVRYAKSGGEAIAIAVRIARAATGREKVFFSGYHGWHDWYLSANLADCSALDGELMPGLSPNGVPRSLRGTSYPIDLNDIVSSIKNAQADPSDIAGIIIEPARGEAIGKKSSTTCVNTVISTILY